MAEGCCIVEMRYSKDCVPWQSNDLSDLVPTPKTGILSFSSRGLDRAECSGRRHHEGGLGISFYCDYWRPLSKLKHCIGLVDKKDGVSLLLSSLPRLVVVVVHEPILKN
eukprot:scaffold3054_cov129-Cylindrotheca_fusiformis.AAC.15